MLFFRLQADSGTGNDLVAETLHYPAFPCCLAVMANNCKDAALQRIAFDSLCSYLYCFDASFFVYGHLVQRPDQPDGKEPRASGRRHMVDSQRTTEDRDTVLRTPAGITA